MKLTKWMFGVLATALFAACSDKDSPTPIGPDEGEGEPISGYLAMRINLPQVSTTRAINDDNVEYNDGESWEYGVNDARVYFFATSTAPSATVTEGTAKFVESASISDSFAPTQDSPNDNITASSVGAAKVTKVTNNQYLWALVMLNTPEDFPTPGQDETFAAYCQRADFSGNFIKTVDGKKYIYMTNAPLSNVFGGRREQAPTGVTISTLEYIGQAANAIYPTLAEAKDNTAACVYVERALAKVSAQKDPNFKLEGIESYVEGQEEGTAWTTDGIEVDIQFALGNINTTSYIIRNVKDINWATARRTAFAYPTTNPTITYTPTYYRMLGVVPMPKLYDPLHETQPTLYRTYWCIDPNYDDQLGNHDQTAYQNLTREVNNRELPNPIYAMENTFSVANQNYKNSTLALLKVTFTVKDGDKVVGDGNLYIVNDNHNVIYTSQFDASSRGHAYLMAQPEITEALKAALKPGVTEIDESDNLAPLILIEYSAPDKNGIIEAEGISLQTPDGYSTLYNKYFDANSVNKFEAALGEEKTLDFCGRINTNFEIKKYTGGVSYYEVPVQHFGDASTPWAPGTDNQVTTDKAYGTDSNSIANYLGRYGMVRNNWYEVNIKSIKKIGSPVPTDLTIDLSDDNNEVLKYIGIETHILSWAKRSQDVSFE